MENYKTVYEQAYCKEFDITIIRKLKYKNDEWISTMITGYYYGEPELKSLDIFKDSLQEKECK